MLVPEQAFRVAQAIFGDLHAAMFPDEWQVALWDEHGEEFDVEGYSRAVMANTSEVWEVDGGTVTNLEPVTFGEAGEDWPDVASVVLLDEFGEVVFRSDLDEPFELEPGNPVSMDVGDLVITVGDPEEEGGGVG